MDKRKNIYPKALDRCRSFGRSKKVLVPSINGNEENYFTKSDSGKKTKKTEQVSPRECFSVYVGPEKQKFVVKLKLINHPLFRMLLDDAEEAYGFGYDGPLSLPCEVDLFYQILNEINSDVADESLPYPPSCSPLPLPLCSPAPGYSYGRPVSVQGNTNGAYAPIKMFNS